MEVEGYITAGEIEALVVEVRKWGKEVSNKLSSSVQTKVGHSAIQNRHEKNPVQRLADSVKSYVRAPKDIPERVSFSFQKQGIYIHYGVGRGRPITKPGTPVDWFNPVLNENFGELVQMLDDFMDGLVINSARMYIPEIDMEKHNARAFEQYKKVTGH